MRTARRIICAISILLVIVVVLSCNNDYGVFSGIQQEIKQSGNTIFQKTPVNNAFRLGNSYYAATRRLQTRAADGGSWSVASIGGSPNYDLRSVVVAGSTIYALIELNGVLSTYSSIDGSTWTSISLPANQLASGDDKFTFDALFATSNGKVYLEGHSYYSNPSNPNYPGSSTYNLYYYNGSAFQSVTTFTPAITKTIRGVVFDGTSNYWFASEDQLYISTDAAGSTSASPPASSSTPFSGLSTPLWSISYVDASLGAGNSGVYVSNQGGVLYRYQGVYPAGSVSSQAVASVPLTQVIGVPTSSGCELLVGTDATPSLVAVGYYEGVFPTLAIGSGGAVTGNTSIYTSTVSTFPVHTFFYDPTATATKVFICVSPGTASLTNYGLYSSVWNSTTATWSGWSAE